MGAAAIPYLLATSIASSLAQGAVGYIGAQKQAAGLDAQAKSAENLAAHQATIARQNAQGQAQDLRFQSGVSRFNRQLAQDKTSRELLRRDQKTRIGLAKKEAAGVRRGALDYSFSDVLRSDAMLAEQETSDFFYQSGEASAQFNSQANLNELMANRAIETGVAQSGIILAEGQNRSNSLSSQASATSIGGIASGIGGIGGASSTYLNRPQ